MVILDTKEDVKPAFCGFAVPRRESIQNNIFQKKRPSEKEEQYSRLEKLWESLWTGEAATPTTSTSAEEDEQQQLISGRSSERSLPILCSRLPSFRLLSAKSSKQLVLEATLLQFSQQDLEDALMPAYPDGYRDPMADY